MTCLTQQDLAALVGGGGDVEAIGVGLRWSAAAESAVPVDRGMRHRSAQRWSFDHPTAIVVVVSGDGPVTVYRHGQVVVG